MYGVQDLLDQMHSMQVYLFEMLQVLTEHRWDRQHRYAVLRVVVDWLQLFLLMVSPAHGWALDTDLWLWQAIEWVQFRTPVANAVRQPAQRCTCADIIRCFTSPQFGTGNNGLVMLLLF